VVGFGGLGTGLGWGGAGGGVGGVFFGGAWVLGFRWGGFWLAVWGVWGGGGGGGGGFGGGGVCLGGSR